jgi:hypothetical protein
VHLRILAHRWIGLMAGWLAALLAAGCASAPRTSPPPPVPAAVAVVPPPAPIAAMPLAVPEAVYRNPKIALVYLRAHQDTEGRLLGPQVMYQVVDPGGWNVDAVEQGHGYIPPVNLEMPPEPASSAGVPARGIAPLGSSSPLLDPAVAAEIVITGLMRPDDQPAAEGLARRQGAGSTVLYDEQAGWLLLPPQPNP